MAVQVGGPPKHFPGLGPPTVSPGRYVAEAQFLKLCYNGIPHRFVREDRHFLMAYNEAAKRDELMELIDNGT